MNALPTIDLGRIREHAGAQHRAFEELSYLLAWDLEGLGGATEIERRSTPDGGIEFSCLPLGRTGRWAWQAKYLFRFDDSAFKQMTKSVLAALDSTPDLTRYIFVLPKDRSDVGIRRWNAAVAVWTGEALRRNMTVDFAFRGETQLIAALTNDQHAGAIRYFFDAQFLTESDFTHQVDREAENLGQRYDPRVNVETEARRIIDAACRAPRFVSELASLIGAPSDMRPYVDLSESSEPLVADGIAAIDVLLRDWKRFAVTTLERLAEPGTAVFKELGDHIDRLATGVDAQAALVDERVDQLDRESERTSTRPASSTPTKPRKRKTKAELAEEARETQRRQLRSFSTGLYRLQAKLDEIRWYLQGDEVKAAANGSVLVVGEAGCGKSHLVADLAKERVRANLPSVLFLGQHLVPGPLHPQLIDLLQFSPMAWGDFMQALDVAARIRRRGRALLVIDAVNEGAGAELWEHQLRGFVAEVAKYEWIALVLTVRDVYEHAVAPSGSGRMVRSIHRGLAGHEEEALTLYAALYELRLPDVPALLPELSNPLFLRSLCQSVQGRGLKEIPREAASLVWVFDGLVDAVDRSLRHPSRLNYGDWENKVNRAVRSLSAAMVDGGRESLSLEEASDVCQAIHADTRNSRSLLNGLIVEGVLLRERADREGTPTETVRFTYQRLSDHLRAEVLLDRHPTNADLAKTIRAIARGPHPWAMSGVIAALVLLVPERRGTELAQVLRLGGGVRNSRHVWPSQPSDWLRREVQNALVDTLMWRSPSTFTDATKDLLNRYLKAGIIEEHEWLRIISGLACVPGHPLNVTWLDPILQRMSLPDRDKAWSRELLWIYSEDSNPVSRMVDWAWSRPDAPIDVARLSGFFLCWLFTSPNRRLRDTAVKALVSVTTHHTALLAELVRHFAQTNDPYVLDGVIAGAYGHVLRRRHEPQTPETVAELVELGRAVFDAVFAEEPKAHITMRHRARSCVHVIDGITGADGATLERDLARSDPPYDTAWPLKAPSGRELAAGFGRSYDRYLGAATEVDWEFEEDLKRHVLTDLLVPDQEKRRRSRRRTLRRELDTAMAALLDSAPPSRRQRVRRQAEGLLEMGLATPFQRSEAWSAFESSLSKTAREHAKKVHSAVDRLTRVDTEAFHPDPDLCVRWVAARMLELGWNKEQFGDQDRRTSRHSGEHTTDRIAKKYERIAFQELCGHLTDHCLVSEYWRDTPEPYKGPWEIAETLTVDPSLLVRGDEPENDTSASRLRAIRLRAETDERWWRTFAHHNLITDGVDDDWLSDYTDIPRPEELLTATDPDGKDWIAVERHQEWSFKDPTDMSRGYRQDRRVMWFRSQAYVTHADDERHVTWAANRNWMGLNGVSTAQDVSTACLGEYPDIEPWPSALDLSDQERRPYEPEDDPGIAVLPLGWEFAHVNDVDRVPYAITSVWCHQETGRDFAATDSPSIVMPSRVLLGLLNAHWSGGIDVEDRLGLGPVEREYSWLANGQVVAFCASGREYGSTRVLWVQGDALRTVLKTAGLGLWSWTLAEKIYWTSGEPSSNRTDCFAAVQLAPAPMTVWGYTIERDSGASRNDSGHRQRVLAERAPGVRLDP